MTQIDTKINMRGWHHYSIELRYLGRTYKEISDALDIRFKKKFAESTIRHWFKKNGRLEQDYLDYAKKENERRRKLIIAQLEDALALVPPTIMDLLTKRYQIAWGKVIKGPDGKPVRKLDSTTVKTVFGLCNLLGFKVEPMEGGDVLDEYYDREEQAIKEETDSSK